MLLADSSLEEVMSYMLVRFGIIAAGVAVLVIIGFTILMVLKRKGKMGQAKRFIEPMARRFMEQQGSTNRPVRDGIRRNATNAIVNYINNQADDERKGR